MTTMVWLAACSGESTEIPPPAPIVAPAPPPAPPARPSPEEELDACLAGEAARTPEGSVACADAATARWEEARAAAEQAIADTLPDDRDPLLVASRDAWAAWRTAELVAVQAVMAQRGSPNPLDLAFDRLALSRERARRLERARAALAGEPELPELKHHPIDETLQGCLRGPGAKPPCVDTAIEAWTKALDGAATALVGELTNPEPAKAAGTAWVAYRDAEIALVGAAYSEPLYAARERHDLIRSRAEQVEDYLVRLRQTAEP